MSAQNTGNVPATHQCNQDKRIEKIEEKQDKLSEKVADLNGTAQVQENCIGTLAANLGELTKEVKWLIRLIFVTLITIVGLFLKQEFFGG